MNTSKHPGFAHLEQGGLANGRWADGGLAVVIGASGALGAALVQQLHSDTRFAQVLGLSRQSQPALDLLDEASIAAAAAHAASLGLPLRLVLVATGFLHDEQQQPEKSWRQLDPGQMARAFALNAIGPALVMKHFLPLLSAPGKSVLATLSAKVGSVGDNRLGGWYSYRASKAALNQLVHTAAIELQRRQAHALCVALHPGTVHSALSAPFAKTGLAVVSAQTAALRLLAVVEQLQPADSGGFFNHDGTALPW